MSGIRLPDPGEEAKIAILCLEDQPSISPEAKWIYNQIPILYSDAVMSEYRKPIFVGNGSYPPRCIVNVINHDWNKIECLRTRSKSGKGASSTISSLIYVEANATEYGGCSTRE